MTSGRSNERVFEIHMEPEPAHGRECSSRDLRRFHLFIFQGVLAGRALTKAMHVIRQNACEASHQRPSVVFTRRDSNPAVIALHPTDSTSTFTCDYEKEPFETHFCCCTSMVCLTCRSGVLGRKKSAPLQAVQPHFWPPCSEFL